MPLHACDFTGCKRPAVRGPGSCTMCDRHICVAHLGKEYHDCPPAADESERWVQESERALQDELTSTLARINFSALRSRASSLRGALQCTVSPEALSGATLGRRMGGQNLHIEVSFVDGAPWLCRVQRQNAASPPLDVQNAVLLSEAATLRFLASTAIPIPEVYEVAPHGTGSDVGVGCILMQKLNGRPLYMHELDDASKRKVLQQYAAVYIELSKHPFSTLGCMQNPGSLAIGPLVHERSATRDDSGGVCQLGPFTSTLDMYTAFAEQQIRFILNDELYVDDPLTAVLVYRYLLDIMPAYLPEAPTDGVAQFYLKHMDDKGDHILIDDDHSIAGVIDWEWAQTMPKEFAFSAPFFLLDVGRYFQGDNGLSSDENLFASILEAAERPDLADCIRNGRLYHRFVSCLEDNISDTEEYKCLFWGLRTLLGLAEHDNPEDDWKFWRVNAELTYADDRDVRALKERLAVRSTDLVRPA